MTSTSTAATIPAMNPWMAAGLSRKSSSSACTKSTMKHSAVVFPGQVLERATFSLEYLFGSLLEMFDGHLGARLR